MADIHIEREHTFGLARARHVAREWAEQAEAEFAMTCRHERGQGVDVVHFSRLGASGTLEVRRDRFELRARLGLLLGLVRARIEAEIVNRLDALLHDEAAAEKAQAKKAREARAGAKAPPPAAKKPHGAKAPAAARKSAKAGAHR